MLPLLILVVLFVIWRGFLFYYSFARSEGGYGLVFNIADFLRVKGRLPSNWMEFVKWESDNNPGSKYDSEELGKHYHLAWDKTPETTQGSDVVIFVDDQALRTFQARWNQALVELMRNQQLAKQRPSQGSPAR